MAARRWPRAATSIHCATGPTPTGPERAIRSRRRTKRTGPRGDKLVVPAKAGTHNPRRKLLQRQLTPARYRWAAAYGPCFRRDDVAVLFLARDDAKLRATKIKAPSGETCPPRNNRQTLPTCCARGRRAAATPLRLNSKAARPAL